MGARGYFEFVQSAKRTYCQMDRLLKNREANAGILETALAGGEQHVDMCEASRIEGYRARLQKQIDLVSRLESCGVDLLRQLPVEKWAQAVGMLYLEDNRVGIVAEAMGYSRRSVYVFAAKAFEWIDAHGLFDETVEKHFPEHPVGP